MAEAVIEYENALRLDPELAEARLNLGMLYKQLGDYERAIEAFRAVIAGHPALGIAAAINLGGVYEDQGRTEDAIGAFRAAVALDPSSGPARYALGRALLGAGDRAGAEGEYQTLRGLDPTWAARLRHLLSPRCRPSLGAAFVHGGCRARRSAVQ